MAPSVRSILDPTLWIEDATRAVQETYAALRTL